MSAADRTAVIIGVGEVTDRPEARPHAPIGPEPASLMARALLRADADAGGGWLQRVQSLDIVNAVSWPYSDLPARVAGMIGHRPARLAYGPVGGETPVRFIDEAARRIARGEIIVAAICGGEAEHSAAAARRAGLAPDRDGSPPWTPPDPAWTNPRRRDYLHPQARRHGLSEPVFVYPLYETACQAAWGQTPRQSRDESAALWSAMSRVAAANPYGWLRRAYSADEIARPAPGNRPIAWPYPKLMTANPVVNQGSAILVASAAAARAAGLPEHSLVYVGPGAAATEPRDWLARDRFDHSPAQEAVLAATMLRAGLETSDLDAVELYSCFPCVPKMARRCLGLPQDVVPTVAGGLTFFGAPLNNYMTHAACAMVRRLRDQAGAVGLLYGQGEFVTKHHALVLATRPLEGGKAEALSVQNEADRRRGPVPPVVEEAEGSAEVETYTILFDREGAPQKAGVVLRQGGSRMLAQVPAEDHDTLVALATLELSAVGLSGRVRRAADGLLEWAVR